MRQPKRTAEEIAQQLADSRHKPFDAFGKHWEGDVWYSDIDHATRKLPASVYSQVCAILENKGYYVHS